MGIDVPVSELAGRGGGEERLVDRERHARVLVLTAIEEIEDQHLTVLVVIGRGEV